MGLDVRNHEVLSFRIMQRHDDARNSGEALELSVRLTDHQGASASVLLSAAPQGPLRANPDVGAGTTAKSVYETYRLPLSAFEDAAPDLNMDKVVHIDWVFDQTSSGMVTIDDLVFARAGLCD